jgi:hypothetical protein
MPPISATLRRPVLPTAQKQIPLRKVLLDVIVVHVNAPVEIVHIRPDLVVFIRFNLLGVIEAGLFRVVGLEKGLVASHAALRVFDELGSFSVVTRCGLSIV